MNDSSTSLLQSFLSTLERKVVIHLQEFLRNVGSPHDSQDSRKVLRWIQQEWDRGLNLSQYFQRGSPIMASHFFTLKGILNFYHHSEPIHWSALEDGVSKGLEILRALERYGGVYSVQTSNTVEELSSDWQAMDKTAGVAFAPSNWIFVHDVLEKDHKNSLAEVSVSGWSGGTVQELVDFVEVTFGMKVTATKKEGAQVVLMFEAQEHAEMLLSKKSIRYRGTQVNWLFNLLIMNSDMVLDSH
ncbi:hypothetical protein QOT17_018963 [Balamuthia mandrillaris]